MIVYAAMCVCCWMLDVHLLTFILQKRSPPKSAMMPSYATIENVNVLDNIREIATTASTDTSLDIGNLNLIRLGKEIFGNKYPTDSDRICRTVLNMRNKNDIKQLKSCEKLPEKIVFDATPCDTSVAMEMEDSVSDTTETRTKEQVDDTDRNVIDNISRDNSDGTKQSCDISAKEGGSSGKVGDTEISVDKLCGEMEEKPMICDMVEEPCCGGTDIANKPENVTSNDDGKSNSEMSECTSLKTLRKCGESSGVVLGSTGHDRTSNSESGLIEVKQECVDISDVCGNVLRPRETVDMLGISQTIKIDTIVLENMPDRPRTLDQSSGPYIFTSGIGRTLTNTPAGTQAVGEMVSRRDHHVHFNVEERKDVVEVQKMEPDYPKDLMEIVQKMKTGDYKSVVCGWFYDTLLGIMMLFCKNIL